MNYSTGPSILKVNIITPVNYKGVILGESDLLLDVLVEVLIIVTKSHRWHFTVPPHFLIEVKAQQRF